MTQIAAIEVMVIRSFHTQENQTEDRYLVRSGHYVLAEQRLASLLQSLLAFGPGASILAPEPATAPSWQEASADWGLLQTH